jgi:hypothetical protein
MSGMILGNRKKVGGQTKGCWRLEKTELVFWVNDANPFIFALITAE